jgi:phosphonate transport system ATP-binding protein
LHAVNETIYQLAAVGARYPGTAPDEAALHDITLTVRRGETVALIGPSGAGKSTLLSTLALARQPSAGALRFDAAEPWLLSSAARHRLRRRLFLAPQVPPLPPRQRVVTAVLAGLLPRWTLGKALASLVAPRDAARAFDALTRFDLGDKLWARVDRLSGGERQRVGLARMLAAETEVMLVDEPLAALDPRLARQTAEAIVAEAARRAATLIVGLHQVDLAQALFPRLIGLRGGRVQFDAPTAAVTPAMLRDLYAGEASADLAAPEMAVPRLARARLSLPARCH